MNQEYKNLGALIKNLKPVHNTEYEVIFNLHENSFFQKLVPLDIIERVRINPEDYFKGLLFLSYFSKIINNNLEVCDNLEELSKKLRDDERSKGIDRGESYLSLETVVIETGVTSKENNYCLYEGDNIHPEIFDRYSFERSLESLNPSDCFYNALGKRIYDLVNQDNKKYLDNVKRRTDLWGIVFTDSCLEFITDESVKKSVLNELDSKNYLNASIISFNEIEKISSLKRVKEAIQKYQSELK